jgi:hypothetical protein
VHGEVDHDRTLAGTGLQQEVFAAAIDMLRRRLGATVLAAG